jgi:hypothetical protein
MIKEYSISWGWKVNDIETEGTPYGIIVPKINAYIVVDSENEPIEKTKELGRYIMQNDPTRLILS